MTNRKLTISSRFIKSRWKSSVQPKIILSGKWLANAGFSIGENIDVQIKNNKLIIEKL